MCSDNLTVIASVTVPSTLTVCQAPVRYFILIAYAVIIITKKEDIYYLSFVDVQIQ